MGKDCFYFLFFFFCFVFKSFTMNINVNYNLPYYAKNPNNDQYVVNPIAYINYYSNPNVNEETYQLDGVDKPSLLWIILRTKIVSKLTRQYMTQILKDFQQGKDFFKKEIEKKDNFYKKYEHLFDKIIGETEKFFEILTKDKGPSHSEQLDHVVSLFKKEQEEKIRMSVEHNNEIKKYTMKIEELQDNEGQLIKALSIGNVRVDEKIFDLETEIKELKKEKEEIIQTRYGFLEKDKKIISQLELKLEEYNKIVLDYKNKEILIRQLTAEKNQIKEETKNELLYIVQSNIQSIITEHPLSYVQKEEYNFILKTKGFQELEEKLKEIIDANRKLLSENNNLKIALDKLKKKLKDKTEEIKSQAKKNTFRNGKHLIERK